VDVAPTALIVVGRTRAMLEIRVIMNSSIEDVLSFKCCNLHDQNFEIHLKNLGSDPITVPNSCELVSEEGEWFRIDSLYPGGAYTIPPGEVTACYCMLADELYARYESIVFTDTEGRQYRAPLKQRC
jgi:hypothetical protein